MNTKRQALALAAFLSATVLTGGAAILGLVHHRPVPSAVPAAVQQAQPAAQAWHDDGGD